MALTPIQLLRFISEKLKASDCLFALCGGVAANIYRSSFRTTNDLDIALFFPDAKQSINEKEFAIGFLESLEIKAKVGHIPGILETSTHLISGELGEFLPTIDFILPSLPWVAESVARAQTNLIDFGFGKIPTLTPEDIILAKAYALSINPNRTSDRDDIESILRGKAIKEKNLLEEKLKKFNLHLP